MIGKFAGAAAVTAVAISGAAGSRHAGGEPPAPMCSIFAAPGHKLVHTHYFLGEATADTVAAGTGSTAVTNNEGHFGPAGSGEMYGQYVVVNAVGGEMDARRPRSGDTVVVVPWDYDSACEPVRWSRSAAWLPGGVRRFYYPKLRAPEYWAARRPTYDAFVPEADVYPSLISGMQAFRAPAGTSLYPTASAGSDGTAPAESVFAFYEAMPALADYYTLTPDQMGAVNKWGAAHPGLTSLYPISAVLRTLAWTAMETHATTERPPIRGTYRVLIRIPGVAPRTMYLRTADRPDGLYWNPQAEGDSLPPLDMSPGIGLKLPFWYAPTETAFPAYANWRRDIGHRADWGWYVAWPETAGAAGPLEASIDPWEFYGMWMHDSAVGRAYRRYEAWSDTVPNARRFPPWWGRFEGDGLKVFREAVPMGPADTLTVEARWIGPATVNTDSVKLHR